MIREVHLNCWRTTIVCTHCFKLNIGNTIHLWTLIHVTFISRRIFLFFQENSRKKFVFENLWFPTHQRNVWFAEQGRSYLNSLFKLEEKSFLQKSEDVNFLKAFIRESFESMAMVNYPYPSEFLAPLPGWPVKVSSLYTNHDISL